MEDQRIGSALRALRIRRGLRQVDLAKAAGIPRGTLMQIEAGRLEDVRLGHIRQLSVALKPASRDSSDGKEPILTDS
jgi:transcriptional regulator with XRE-family HTH domain